MTQDEKKLNAGAKEVIARIKRQKREKLAAQKSAAKKSETAKKPAAKRVGSKRSNKNKNAVKDNKLEMVVTIVNRNKAEYYIDLMNSFDINIQLVTLGHGTADAKTLAYFGVTDIDKAVIIGVIQENKIPELISTLEEKFRTIKNGKGIAYTVPLTGVIGTLIFGFLSNNRRAVKTDSDTTESKV